MRRSQKRGVEVSVKEFDDALIRDIVELTKDSPTRQGKRFLHYGKTFEQTKKDQSTHLDRSDFICAYSGNELIGLLKIVYSGSLASVLQFLPKASEQEKRPANALIAKAVEVCEAKGISYLIYGLFNYGNKRHDSLLEFKTRNGFEEFLVPRFYVPLTLRGVIYLKFKLHRGIIGPCPMSLFERPSVFGRSITILQVFRAGVAQSQSSRIVFGRRSVQILPPAPLKIPKFEIATP